MKTHWRVIKTDQKRFPWELQGQHYFDDGTCSEWAKVSDYKTRKAAVSVGLIIRERGEPISWPGGAIRIGIALIQSC